MPKRTDETEPADNTATASPLPQGEGQGEGLPISAKSAESAVDKSQARRQALEEARKIISVDIRNSCDQCAHFIDSANDAQLLTAWDLLLSRVGEAAKKLTILDEPKS